MKIYLFINPDNRITGYHITHVDGTVEHDATEIDLDQLKNNDGYLFYSEGSLVHRTDLKAKDEANAQLMDELQEIASWFSQSDWIPNKVVVGEWDPSDQRFVSYKVERLAKRARQDEINSLLESEGSAL